jgi:hypothetical protein
MRIEYACKDGSRTIAKWPSMALLHWLGRSPASRRTEPKSTQQTIARNRRKERTAMSAQLRKMSEIKKE